ncbi:MAG: 3-hydroxyacyl-CoA dehydrogenase [Candidatus Bathyarchaeota archaeon]|nr:3-hydroxyacyl-CoA dehydrogenase [Candidatus Bathyarchaeota archaeon]
MKAAVIGAGIMGHGIAELLALAGYDVTLVDISDEVLKKALDNIQWSLGKFVQRKRIQEEDAKNAMSRIKTSVEVEEAASDADLVVEAVPENLELKKSIFKKVDKAAPSYAILASNTSSLSITEMGKVTGRPDKVVGLHFFNPPALMVLVEVIKGDGTSEETVDAAVDIVKKLGKTPVVVRRDVRGFIVNRVLGVVLNEAFWAVQRGEATMEEVDAAVKYKAGFPLGAFELSDMIGLDVLDEVSTVLEEAYGDAAKACPIVKKLVQEGNLGQKTGKGFYDWKVGRPRISFRLAGKFDVNRLYAVAVNEAARLIHEDVAGPEDIDQAMKLGTGWPSGPCEQGDKLGLDTLLEKLKELYSKYGEEAYRQSPLLEEYVGKGFTGKSTGRGFYEYG